MFLQLFQTAAVSQKYVSGEKPVVMGGGGQIFSALTAQQRVYRWNDRLKKTSL